MKLRSFALAVFAVLALLLAACGSDGSDGADTSPSTTADGETAAPSGSITVSAAASLTEAFTAIGEDFEAANPDTEIEFNFDSSTTLATQIVEGAPADVFASADQKNMDELVAAEEIDGEPDNFATNDMVIVTKPGNPEGIDELADLADVGIVALCGEDAPCGRFAGEVLDNADVTIDEGNITRGQNVRATLDAVTEGDAVAGLVYVTDAASAGDAADTVAIPDDVNAVAVYPIGVVAATEESDVAEAFVTYVGSDAGLAVLEDYGFLPPA